MIRKARQPMPELPMIRIFGYTQESVAREVETIEEVRFLAKPFGPEQRAGTVKNTIHRTVRAD